MNINRKAVFDQLNIGKVKTNVLERWVFCLFVCIYVFKSI